MHMTACLAPLLVATLSAPLALAETSTQVYLDNGELNYVGSISVEANQRALALFASEETKPRVLAIRSKGGPTDAGMALGTWVRARALTVKVLEYCFSSCANYVFTAAPRKIVSNFAVVGYHGGLSSATFAVDEQQEAMLAALPAAERQAMRQQLQVEIQTWLASQREAERQYFAQIGVQQRITTMGQTPELARHFDADSKVIGWTFSADDFAKLGVTDITVINPPWQPRFIASDKQVHQIKLP